MICKINYFFDLSQFGLLVEWQRQLDQHGSRRAVAIWKVNFCYDLIFELWKILSFRFDNLFLGETDLGQLSKQISTRDLPTQMTLKYRQDGQGKEEEYESLKATDFKKDLEVRERKAREERNKEKHYKTSGR